MKPSLRLLWATVGALSLAALPAKDADAKDEPKFGPAVDAFCTAEGRDPATPFADGESPIPLTECQLCHQPFTFDKVNVTPGYAGNRCADSGIRYTRKPGMGEAGMR